ncbi:MAG: HAMP domain-containing sensor histidine kinase [Candidatus Pacebacteria bacterium]|nr:HAMP domain-containing sensor histidine kinase [Candidatus Paceibacterota bacterium]
MTEQLSTTNHQPLREAAYEKVLLRMKCFMRGFYRLCFESRSLDEDKRRKGFILNVILFSLSSFLVVLSLLDLLTYVEEGPRFIGIPPLFFIGFTCLFCFLYLLARKGYLFVSYVFIGLYTIAITYGAYTWGGDLPSVLLNYALVIFITSIVISPRVGLWLTAGIISMLCIIGYYQSTDLILVDASWKNEIFGTDDQLEYAATLAVIAILSWLSNREIERSLRRARKSEKDLKQERDQLEVTVKQRTDEVQRLQNEKLVEIYKFVEFGRLSAGLFHDLMSPLTALSLSAQQISENQSDNKIEDLSFHIDNARRTGKKIEDYVNACRQHIHTKETTSMFEIATEIERALLMLRYSALEAKVEIIFKKPVCEMLFCGNSIKFYQIMINLISNAIEGCKMKIGDEPKNVFIETCLNKSAKTITVSVKDNGTGVPEELSEKIFEPFFSTKSLSSKSSGGCGLGLATTKHVIEKDFGGNIKVATIGPNNPFGAIFICTLPLKNY